MITGRDLIESQKLYSTGDDDLDELLEMAFCDGYEYAQHEFSDNELKEELKEAIRKGDEDKIKEIKRKRAYRSGLISAGAGGAVAGIGAKRFYKNRESDIRAEMKKIGGDLGDVSKKDYDRAVNISSGILGLGGAAVTAGVGHVVNEARFNRTLDKARDEVKEEKKKSKKK